LYIAPTLTLEVKLWLSSCGGNNLCIYIFTYS
jgi:hypothetical protein